MATGFYHCCRSAASYSMKAYAMHFCSSAELLRVLEVPGKAAFTASDMRVSDAPK